MRRCFEIENIPAAGRSEFKNQRLKARGSFDWCGTQECAP